MQSDSFLPLNYVNSENIALVCLSKKDQVSNEKSFENMQFNSIECSSWQEDCTVKSNNVEQESIQKKSNEEMLVKLQKLSNTKEDCSNILNRSIKKGEKNKLLFSTQARKNKFLLQLRQKKILFSKNGYKIQRTPLSVLSGTRPKKHVSELVSFQLSKTIQEHFSIPISKTTDIEKSSKKNICCLNKVASDVKKLHFSGINVFLDSDEPSFSFPIDGKTTKFIVQ